MIDHPSVWLVRHASTAWTGVRWCGRSDPSLSPAGHAEASALAVRLAAAARPGSAILSSPARRAAATAAAVAARTGGSIVPDPDLQEIHLGRVDGLTFDELATEFPDLAARLLAGQTAIDWPGGERVAEVRARAARVWTRLAGRATDAGEVVAVSHGGLIVELQRAAGLGSAAIDPRPSPASAVRIDRMARGWQIGARVAAATPPRLAVR